MRFSQLYFSFDGRIGRKTYWTHTLLLLVLSLGMSSMLGVIDVWAQAQGMLIGLWQLLVVWPSLALSVKRWHDCDKSGWWILLYFIPIFGPIWALVKTGCFRGSDGPNRFGLNTF